MKDLKHKWSAQEAKLQEYDRKFQDVKAYIMKLASDAGLALDHIEALQKEIQNDRAVTAIKQESEHNGELVTQLEDVLNATEQKMRTNEEALTKLQGRISTLECEHDHAEKSHTNERNAKLEEAKDPVKLSFYPGLWILWHCENVSERSLLKL